MGGGMQYICRIQVTMCMHSTPLPSPPLPSLPSVQDHPGPHVGHEP